ncbi:hypothetical protein BTHERMOSOX_1229 [Bathymodiolus thermophilus thioautotrophic gill symbiont]|jgi:hypothetical protein|uniref:Uncharacterized protein n=1 Tax=Bathymodiolus thermophilus thioautotrophic gill symbiont TaxID=2360 RepID=A0A3G3IK45_9GAMM|nr:hypothetical protein [Bathymodiolus thermophilus thioautotrophic gill symbiont]AYQ56121.1 hypothetical protein MS2017_0375 [Bathymodiolus thermophilus thioautotrophic gill symbiont]CAB5502137.1 hypothetical protein THERMOS_1531 [Bathymodiolus thermophilus thioautotrophic gill symbiont]SGZ88431.1 hypothetical protein BTHERMOSOX_1229 [Bathymodiolus thermophilus thioautotrophic gill symbiont]
MKTTIGLDEMKNVRGGNINSIIIPVGVLIMLVPVLAPALGIVEVGLAVS